MKFKKLKKNAKLLKLNEIRFDQFEGWFGDLFEPAFFFEGHSSVEIMLI
jgi:hypothetical protein